MARNISPDITTGVALASVLSMARNIERDVRENRLRRMAQRQGVVIVKSRRRDPRARDYGLWTLTDADHDRVLHGLTTDEIETYLLRDLEAE